MIETSRVESLQEWRENFLLQGQLCVPTLILESIPPLCYHSSTSQSFCRKCRWQFTVNTHAHYACYFKWSDTVNWCCMVVWCTQNAYWDSSSFTWHQPCNNETALSVHHFRGYLKHVRKRMQSLIWNHMWQEQNEYAQEQRMALCKSNQ